MRKIINGKAYDTDKATEVGESTNGYGPSDFKYEVETLYRKRTGEYFLHGYGHAMSRYAEAHGDNCWGPGERIIPMSYEGAMKWAEERLDAEEYEREFGVVDDEGDVVAVSFRVPSAAKAALDRECSRTGESQSAIISRLLGNL